MKKKIVIFSGAGLDAESGIETFRGTTDSIWNNHNIDDVATPEGWAKDSTLVNNFYNERRAELETTEPNEAHTLIASLEDKYDVTNITQNVTNLLERGGSTNVIHLHGELTKARCVTDEEDIMDIGYQPITDSLTSTTHNKLRPHIVWFSEMPFRMQETHRAIIDADILIIVGTSFNIAYTSGLVNSCKWNIPVYYVDPAPVQNLFGDKINVNILPVNATTGMETVINILK